MRLHRIFCLNLIEHIKAEKNARKYSDKKCRDKWKFDAAKIINRGGNINSVIHFKYALALDKCPVEFMILLLKPELDPERLVNFIIKEYNLSLRVIPVHTA